MQFLGHGGAEQNPVYPWYFQVDSVPTTLICDTIHNLNVKGETWQANATNILNGPTEGLFKGNTLIDYTAAAIIFSDFLFHGAKRATPTGPGRCSRRAPRTANISTLMPWLSTTPPSR
jgi:hypothetical protein